MIQMQSTRQTPCNGTVPGISQLIFFQSTKKRCLTGGGRNLCLQIETKFQITYSIYGSVYSAVGKGAFKTLGPANHRSSTVVGFFKNRRVMHSALTCQHRNKLRPVLPKNLLKQKVYNERIFRQSLDKLTYVSLNGKCHLCNVCQRICPLVFQKGEQCLV